MSCEKVALLYSRSRSQWRLGAAVNFWPNNISDQINLIWWCIIMSQRIIGKYSFAIFNVRATVIFTVSSDLLKLLQPKLVWWYIITRQGKTFVKRFSCFYSGCETGCGLSDCGPECCHSWPYSYLKQRSVLVPIKKMWTEHCFCNEYILVYILLYL